MKLEDRKFEPVIVGKSGVTSAGWHAIESFLRCEKEYQLKHVRKVFLPTVEMPDYFAVGMFFHAGRAAWFASHFDSTEKGWQKIVKAVAAESEQARVPTKMQAERYALEGLRQYVNHYLTRPRPTPVAVEYLIGPVGKFFGRTARLDDVSYYPEGQGQLFIGECKTTGSTLTDAENEYTQHGQTLLQRLLFKLSKKGTKKLGKPAGIMLDLAQKGYGGRKWAFKRVPIRFTPFQLAWYQESMDAYITKAQDVKWDSFARRNPHGCTRQIGRRRVECPYRKLCQSGPDATVHYKMGENGASLKSHKPVEGKKAMPWE